MAKTTKTKKTETKIIEIKWTSESEGHNYYRSHIWANMRHLEDSIKENLREADIHHKMAQDQQKRELSLRTE